MSAVAEGRLEFHVNLSVSAAEMATWSPRLITAFFDGVAKATEAVEYGRSTNAMLAETAKRMHARPPRTVDECSGDPLTNKPAAKGGE